MIRGWYIGSSGMNAQQNRLNVIANNLANVDTTGFKRDTAVSKNFSELLIRRTNDDGVYKISLGSADAAPIIGKMSLGVETNESFTDFSQGSYKETGSKTDVAFSAAGFFTVQTPGGERYTRNGNFMIGKEGLLETKDGYPVLGEKGPIYVADTEFFIDKDGIIYDSEDMREIERFKTVRFENERYLKKQGSSLYAETDISGPAYIAEGEERPAFLQGFVETSNVNVVNEMVQMIEVNRAYEANQKTIQAGDTMMSVLWSKTASLRG
ncbi:flagellar basal-body rod protein FlgF [Treponema sp. OMZ 840]|uniref:flagellar basal-body rod protein FlgF n=1 Tax=Treponema sp. OMZ 840 TaxID=244313 RepID=UPI003D9339D3